MISDTKYDVRNDIKREVIKDKYDSYILIPEQKETVINHVGNSNLRYKNNVTIDNLEK